MALNKIGLKQSIKDLLTQMEHKNEDSKDFFAGKLADAIDVYVKSATIIIAAGVPVATTGTAVAQTGVTTAPATATIN
jgi:hypothetical protein